jgi:hypothetical protein
MPKMRIESVTLDTNVFPAQELIERAERLGIRVAAISTSARESEGSHVHSEVVAVEAIPEFAVLGEWRLGEAVLGSDADADRFELALRLLSNEGFPGLGGREELGTGQRRQLRDAMILCRHVSAGRDLFVSNDSRAFINHGRREQIEAAFGTRIMSGEEFERYVAELEDVDAV